MRIRNHHVRFVPHAPDDVFAALSAMGTDEDRLWPAPSMPFVRTPGPLRAGLTRERHGIIRAVLDAHEPNRVIRWRAELPFLTGTHGFELGATEGGCEVAHRLDADLAWWFAPVWKLKIGAVHDRLIEALLDRVEQLPRRRANAA